MKTTSIYRLGVTCVQRPTERALATGLAHRQSLADGASLQRPNQGQILTPRQLFTWAEKNFKGIYIPALGARKKMSRKSQEGLSRRFL